MGQQVLNLAGLSKIKLDVDLQTSSFDRISRYYITAQIINELIKGKDKEVLDVGGLGSILPRLVKQKVKILDVDENSDPNYIKGSALDSPLKDNTFDAVITCDTLEHIPSLDRPKFIRELIRISKDLVIICAPYNKNGAAEAEIKMNSLYKKLTGTEHRWLKEHIDIGIPSVRQTEDTLKSANVNYISFGHTDIQSWLTLIELNFLAECIEDTDLRKMAAETNQLYNKSLIYEDFSEIAYRQFYIISKNSHIKIEGVLPGSAKKILSERIHAAYADTLANLGTELVKKRVNEINMSVKVRELTQERNALKSELESIHASKGWKLLQRSYKSRDLITKYRRK